MKSYEDILEFYKIKNELVDFSYFNETKEKYIDLEIYTNKVELEYELSLLEELIDFYKYDGGFNIETIKETKEELKKLEILASYLEPIDLLNIRINLGIYRKSQNRAKQCKEKYKKIYKLFSENIDTKEMEKIIDDIIDENANIKDDANSNIFDIRRQKKIISQNIKEKIENIFTDPNLQNAIDNKIITTRNDRYVINIKTDFKGQIKGIEHDRSASGNSVFIEPLTIVSLNNKLREFESKEREEVRRLLLRLSEYLRKNKEMLAQVYEGLKRLDFLNAKVQFSNKYDCSIAKICEKPMLNIVMARHPLLNHNKVVPLSFSLTEDQRIMMITGPNTGGKTVTLKLAGLLSLMTLSGLSIPASDKTTIGMFDRVLADIGDEQSIEQNLSSFSSHVRSISHLIDVCTNKSLVLLDELGSGTDPQEGSAFAMAIIDYLNSKKVYGIISTHYSEVKAHAYNTKNIKSASMEFDVSTLKPTYRLIEGIPGESNALIIAKNYGISDEIIKNAKSYISEDNKRVEKMILAIKQQNEQLEQKNKEINELKQELEDKKISLEQEIKNLQNEKEKIIEKSIQDADNYLRQMQNKAKSLIDKINREDLNKENIKAVQRNINMLYDSIREDKKKIKDITKVNKEKINFTKGEEVYVKSINQNAIVINIVENKNSVQIQKGIVKLLVPVSEIKKIDKKTKPKTKGSVSYKLGESKHVVDVRGKFASDAINDIDSFLDKAILSGYHSVHIVHGKGTMVLRNKIREYLKESAYVNDFFDANENEGGKGCTIVNLK